MRKRKLFPRVSPFFREPGRSASSEDALLLIDIIQEAFHDPEADDLIDGAWRFMEGTVENAMVRYRAGELPLQAVEVAAAFTPIGRPKNYGVRPLWELALDLGDFLGRYPPHSRTSEEVTAANRIAPLGAGGNARVIIQELRGVRGRGEADDAPECSGCAYAIRRIRGEKLRAFGIGGAARTKKF